MASNSITITPGISTAEEIIPPALGLTRDVSELVNRTMASREDVVLAAAKEVAKEVAKSFLDQQKRDNENNLKKVEANQKLDRIDFENKGNQNQFEHCRDMLNNVEDSMTFLESGDLAQVRKNLEEGKKKLLKRIKLIRIADRNGWSTVQEYISDDLASDSDDEKCLQKAIKTASLKQEKRKKERKPKQFNKRLYNAAVRSPYNSQPNYNNLSVRHLAPRTFSNRPSFTNLKQCWNCSGYGHLFQQCPALRNTGSNTQVVPKQNV